MPVAPRSSSSSDIEGALKVVNNDLREHAMCLEHVSGLATVEDKSKFTEELKCLNGKLVHHRMQMRQWKSKADRKDKKNKEKVEAMQGRIEEEIRKFKDHERAMKHADAAEKKSSTEVKVMADQLVRHPGSDDDDMIEELICKICYVHVVGSEPKLTRCSHLFCGDCIAMWFSSHSQTQSWAQRAQGAGSVPCPVCKEILREDQDLFPVSNRGEDGTGGVVLWQMLCGLEITCVNQPRCSWKGYYGDYVEHHRTCLQPQCEQRCTSVESVPTARAASAAEDVGPAPDSWEAEGSEDEAPHCADSSSTRISSASESDEPSESTAHDRLHEVKHRSDRPASVAESSGEATSSSAAASSEEPPAEPPQSWEDEAGEEPAAQAVVAAVEEEPEPIVEAEPAAIWMTAIAPFEGSAGSAQLTLQAGDHIEVHEQQNSGWTYGRKLRIQNDTSSGVLDGWFPSWAVRP